MNLFTRAAANLVEPWNALELRHCPFYTPSSIWDQNWQRCRSVRYALTFGRQRFAFSEEFYFDFPGAVLSAVRGGS